AAACNGAALIRDLARCTAFIMQDPVSAVHRKRCTAHGMTGEGGALGGGSARHYRLTSQVVTISPVAGALESLSWMPMAASSSRIRSASAKFLALRAAVRAAIIESTFEECLCFCAQSLS